MEIDKRNAEWILKYIVILQVKNGIPEMIQVGIVPFP
jgi:hypothetical protein